jgi:tetratricopeptide (TPR) repeat protein
MRAALLCMILLISVPALSQSRKALEKAGDEAYAEQDFNTALQHYADALTRSPSSIGLQYKYALVAQEFNAFEIAETHFITVTGSPESLRFPDAYFHLGRVQKAQGKYTEAIASFKKYQTLKATGVEKTKLKEARQELANCRWAQSQSEDPLLKVRHLGRSVNTDYSEFAPLGRGDTLYYTSYRYELSEDDNDPPRKYSKLLYSRSGSRGRPVRRINETDKIVAHATFSENGNRIYYTLCEYVGTAELRCDIYYREKDSRGRWGRKGVRLGAPLNDKNSTSTHPSLGYDSLLQHEILFFASDRPGGKGGLDLWFAAIKGDSIGEVTNLSIANTPGDDITPFFHNPSQRLFFSSEGHQNRGEFDVFELGQISGNWQPPIPLPAPVNTSYDDLYYTLNQDGKSGYLASNRPGSNYLDEANKACCNDLFAFVIKDPIPPEPIADTIPLPPVVDVPPEPTIPETLEDFIPLRLYFDNDEPDKRTRRTTTKKAYDETFADYYNRKEIYMTEYIKPLKNEDQRYEGEVAMDYFFETEVHRGYDHLQLFSEILLRRLEEGESVEIFIKGFTSPRAKSDYNLALGKRRISSVRNHFQLYGAGVFVSYIESGALKITERSFGETTVSGGVSDDLKDLRNSVYSIDAAKERRVEVVEIRRSGGE